MKWLSAVWNFNPLVPVIAGGLGVGAVLIAGPLAYNAVKSRWNAGQDAQEAIQKATTQGTLAEANTALGNAQAAAQAENTRVERVTVIREIEKESGRVVAEAVVREDLSGVIAGWESAIDRMREPAPGGRPEGDPHERP